MQDEIPEGTSILSGGVQSVHKSVLYCNSREQRGK